MEINSLPKLIEFSEEYIDTIFKKGRTAIILFTDDITTDYYTVFKNASELYLGNPLFIVSGTMDGV